MTYRDFWHHLTSVYDEGEAKAVARMVYEVRFGLSWTDLCIGKDTQLSADNQTELQEILRRLLQKEPVQYVLEQADFCGRTFLVNEHVLIPRPETEELIQWFLEVRSYLGESEEGHILDIGTGSGCIAITLAAMYPNAHVTAWDISPEALDVAKVNAGRHHVSVTFQQVDILAPSLPTPHSSLPLVYDLYTGTGTIANFVARQAREVIGIEYVPEAIEDAKINSQLNGITNTRFYAGDMKDILNDAFIEEHGRPDVIITDPPRAGMHPDVVKTILRAAPQRIVYVSCNPATQARDLQDLDAAYRVVAVQPVDMFPHTPHVENVVLLEQR
jgi:methylase of polypeptide subunit release factors